MTVMHVRQIETMLRERYEDWWDDELDDANNLSRLLALYAAELELGLSATDDGCHVEITDGEGDGGIDAIGVNIAARRVVVVQSKWRQDGSGSLDLAGVLKFTTGVKGLLDIEMEGPATWSEDSQEAVRAAMDAVGGRIRLVAVTTAENELSDEVKKPIDDLLVTVNGQGVEDPLATDTVLLQGAVWESMAHDPSETIDFRLQLLDWGKQDDPHTMYYGRASALDLARLHEVHGDSLFAENIRMFLSRSGINDGIRSTVADTPELLLYYNNGITVLADSVDRGLQGAAGKEAGTFDLAGASVVNGAQTVTSLGMELAAGHEEELARAYVLVRCIQLAEDDDDLGRRVTRYANTQNVVASQDFAFLDPEQHRLRKELKALGYDYLIRSGETSDAGDPDKVIPIRELAVALACASGTLNHTVLAKSEVSRLFAQDGGVYKALFNPTTSALVAARAVRVVRAVDQLLGPIKKEGPGRRAGVAQHGRLVISRLVIHELGLNALGDVDRDFEADLEGVPALVERFHEALVENFPDGYAGNLFKTQARVSDLVDALPDVTR